MVTHWKLTILVSKNFQDFITDSKVGDLLWLFGCVERKSSRNICNTLNSRQIAV